eukprot:gene8278-35315_t
MSSPSPDPGVVAEMVATMSSILPPESSADIPTLLAKANYDLERALNAYYNPANPPTCLQSPPLALKLKQALPSKRQSYGGGSSASKRPRMQSTSGNSGAAAVGAAAAGGGAAIPGSGAAAAAAGTANPTTSTTGTTATATTHKPRASRQQQQQPLAERVRPTSLDQLVGQKAFAADSPLGRLVQADRLPSVILWGPPGCGKTTLATILAKRTKHRFCKLLQRLTGKRTVLFLDEVHRWQDCLLPHIETGLITLLGATTENPSFTLNSALLSRCRVVVMDKLGADVVEPLLKRALSDPRAVGLPEGVSVADDVLQGLAQICDGDYTDDTATANVVELTVADVEAAIQRTHLLYDRAGEEHYNIISALHKCMRGGDANAAIYWLARMLEAGEDPRYVARRLVRFAAEDIGLADPQALLQASAAFTAASNIGMPESGAYNAAVLAVKEAPNAPVPLHIRNAPTRVMKGLGYGKGYTYPPDNGYIRGCEEGFMPKGELHDTTFFNPKDVEPGHTLYPN